MTIFRNPQTVWIACGLVMLVAAAVTRRYHRLRLAAFGRLAERLDHTERQVRTLAGQLESKGFLTTDDRIQSLPTPRGNSKPRRPTRFMIDSVQVAASFRYVCGPNSRAVNGSFNEVFHWAAGIKVDDATYVITKIIEVSFSRQSAGGVRVDDSSNIAALGTLDDAGLILLGHFHSHPGHGRNSNRPSCVDRRFQERLERGGHICVGGIFTRDGFLRFFAGDLDRFVVDVVGNGVNKVGDNEFKLVDNGNALLRGFAGAL